MRVAFNAMYLDPGVSGGTETYLRNLLPALAAQGIEPVVLTTRRAAPTIGIGEAVALKADEGERLNRLVAEQVAVPRAAKARGCVAVHSLANTGPLFSSVPHVLTLHDLQAFTTDAMGLVSSLTYRVLIRGAARRAARIVTGAQTSRAEIQALLGVDSVVIPHGPGRPPGPAEDLDAVRARHALTDPMVLCVAAKRPHKNQELLLRALPDGATLVLVGHPEAYDAKLRALAAELGVADRVRFLSDVPDAELEALWQISACGAFPTRAEGFGLPVLEAMRRGVAVACSDIPVLREIGGDVPAYFGTDDVEGARHALERAITADGEAGRARAERFTWEAAARSYVEVYASCTSG